MYCRISLNKPTVAATGSHIIYVLSFVCRKLRLSVSEVEKCYSMHELGLLFDHKLSQLKSEIHVVMHLSQWRLQTRCQNINFDVALQVATATSQTRCQNKNLSSSNALALKGDGR